MFQYAMTFFKNAKNTISRTPSATVAALLLGGALLGTPASQARAFGQAPPATGAAQFGSVDIGQVLNDSKIRQRDAQELNELGTSFRSVVQQLQTGSARFLTEAEIREYATLLEKPTPNDNDKKRMAALQGNGDAKAAALTRLENVTAPTDEQKKQYSDLTDARQKGDQTVKTIADDMSKRFDARDVELTNKTILDIKAVIAKIAQDKGLAVVFDGKTAWYTANDITAEVIKQVNAKK